LSIKQLLIQPFQTLFIRWSKVKNRVPKFPATEKGQWSVTILVSMNGKTNMEDINQLAVLSRKVFSSVKILVFGFKDVLPSAPDSDILFLSRRDFTLTGKLAGRIQDQLGKQPADLLLGLSENEHPLYQHLINQLPIPFKAGIASDTDMPAYHVVLRLVPTDQNVQQNFTQLLEYLTKLKIKT